MSKLLALAMIACALASGCASLRAPTDMSAFDPISSARLTNGSEVAAPSGLAAFCSREPDYCTTSSMRARGGEKRAPAMVAFDLGEGVDGGALPARAGPGLLELEPRIVLTGERWGELRRVNLAINQAITPGLDQVRYGLAEYWTMPITIGGHGAPAGDCEDYALEKRARLIALGWPAHALALAVAIAPQRGRHAVLIARTDRGDFVLDNLYDEPRTLDSLSYQWLSLQSGPDLLSWASARYENLPRARARDVALVFAPSPLS